VRASASVDATAWGGVQAKRVASLVAQGGETLPYAGTGPLQVELAPDTLVVLELKAA
jgi:hypothetical protein